MATYSVVFRPDRTAYDVVMQDDIGGRHTILGFQTEAAAQAWITEDQRMTGLSVPDAEP